MVYKVIMPNQGLQMTEGTIVQWLVEEGGIVKTGEPLFELETDKAVITIDAEASGTLLKIINGEGDTVPVAEIVAVIGEPGENYSALLSQRSSDLKQHIKQYKVFRPEDIKPFGEGDYQSRLLLDSLMAGEKCVNVNHGTFAPGAGVSPGEPGAAPGGFGSAHKKAEIYFGVYGEADVYIEGEPVYIARGTLVYIPGGSRHCVVNRSRTERFELLTIWADEKDNDMHAARVKAWGTSYKRAGE